MKKHKMPDMKEGGVNVTPLIDVVMCLIIFFMLVAKIGVSRGVDAHIVLPDAIIGTTIKEMGQTLTLNVHHLEYNGPQVTALVGSVDKEIPLLDGSLLKVLIEFKKTHSEKATVIMRGDEGLTFGELEPVLMAVAAGGITDTAYEVHEVAKDDKAPK